MRTTENLRRPSRARTSPTSLLYSTQTSGIMYKIISTLELQAFLKKKKNNNKQCINSKHTVHFTTVSSQNFVHQLNNWRTSCFSSFSPSRNVPGRRHQTEMLQMTTLLLLWELLSCMRKATQVRIWWFKTWRQTTRAITGRQQPTVAVYSHSSSPERLCMDTHRAWMFVRKHAEAEKEHN